MTRPTQDQKRELRRGWTTGACATAATKAALELLATGTAPDPVAITLPRGEQPEFALALKERGPDWARTGIIKDAGDDPDVTHGCTVIARVARGAPGGGVVFKAGDGVGTVTKAGLPIAPGEPAINPRPREMMTEIVTEAARRHGFAADFEIEIAIPGGAALAEKTWNPRLGIMGGLSILGTTGIVHPFSCSSWIHSIHSGIDVARADGLTRIAGSTGSTSEAAVQRRFELPQGALIDMGDFVGGMLKYLKTHPVPEVVIAGGFAKITKLSQGAVDLHSARSQVDFGKLADEIKRLGAGPKLMTAAKGANTAAEVLEMAGDTGLDLAGAVAAKARTQALEQLGGAPITVEVVIVDRTGKILAHAR